MPYNHNWYNSHETRRYPLDGTGTGDDGTQLKDDIIADVHLRWPSVAGQYAYIGGITVTPTLVTVIVLAADSPTTAVSAVPLAAVSLVQPVVQHRQYFFEGLYPGTAGAIAFGDPAEPFSIRFGSPAQGLLSPRIARPYAKLPIPSLRKFGRADALTGLVRLLGGQNIEVVKEMVTYDGEETDALVVRLIAPTLANNVLRDYSGPCSARPESNSCRKLGVEAINDVLPNCNGNLEIEFRRFTPGEYESCGKVTD